MSCAIYKEMQQMMEYVASYKCSGIALIIALLNTAPIDKSSSLVARHDTKGLHTQHIQHYHALHHGVTRAIRKRALAADLRGCTFKYERIRNATNAMHILHSVYKAL